MESAMPVWKAKPVSQQPEVTLVRWSVIETDKAERHFVGYCLEDRWGRVSSAIRQFDQKTLCGVTQSGRVYKLSGPSGYDPDATYVWERWSAINGVRSAHDVSPEIADATWETGSRATPECW
jgi:hypothetical protein